MIKLLKRALRHLESATESAGTAISRHYSPLTHPSRRV